MVLTPTQKANLRFYLGRPTVNDPTSLFEQAVLRLQDDDEATTQVIAILASLATVDAALVDARRRIKVLEASNTKFPGQMEIATLRSEGRRFVGRLASILGVSGLHDVYSGAGPRPSNVILLG